MLLITLILQVFSVARDGRQTRGSSFPGWEVWQGVKTPASANTEDLPGCWWNTDLIEDPVPGEYFEDLEPGEHLEGKKTIKCEAAHFINQMRRIPAGKLSLVKLLQWYFNAGQHAGSDPRVSADPPLIRNVLMYLESENPEHVKVESLIGPKNTDALVSHLEAVGRSSI